MREWREIHGQLHTLVMEIGLRPNEIPAGYDEIHRALLAGLLGNIGFKTDEDGEYLGARGIKFSIFPGSVLKKAKPKWVVAAELTETTKLYGRCVAKIDPLWVEKIAGRLCKKHYFDPHWEKQTAQVAAFERVTLYGLTVMPKRRVYYGTSILKKRVKFLSVRRWRRVNMSPKRRSSSITASSSPIVEALEHKARRQDVLVDEGEIFAFYDAIIPDGICNGAEFEKWRRQAERENPRLLYLTQEYLMRHEANRITGEQYPDSMVVDGIELPDGIALPLAYRFDPGHVLDGVTVTVPLPLLNKLDTARFDGLVPGLIREKITWYLKALPKQIRRHVVPIPEFVTQFLESQESSVSAPRTPLPMSLTEILSRFIQAKTRIAVPQDAWQDEKPPPHLLMNYKIVDDAGQELAMSRDLSQLKAKLGQAAQLDVLAGGFGRTPPIERDDVKRWDFGDLPEEIAFTRAGKKLTGYPALVE